MRLDRLLEGLVYSGKISPGAEIYDICTRPEDVFENTAFVAVRGRRVDSHRLIDEAVERGASCIVCEDPSYCHYLEISVVVVTDSRHALAVMSGNLFSNPSEKLRMIGITGTNGKTTTSYMTGHILSTLGKNVGIVGTLGSVCGTEKIHTSYTTPEPKALQSVLSRFVCGGCEYSVMEVSSQGLDQRRTDGISFEVGVFTNFSEDHLDYHGTSEAYLRAKERLALQSRNLLVSSDSPFARRFRKMDNVCYFSVGHDADFYATDVESDRNGSRFTFCRRNRKTRIYLPMPGLYNVENALAALSVVDLLCPDSINESVLASFPGVCGRLEKLNLETPFDVYIDFAHTPEALRNLLLSVREMGYRRILLVFGCGGERDGEKRPKMGAIASELADLCIITNDNPRSENPDRIIRDILSDIRNPARCSVVTDRREAIRYALSCAEAGDAVILAGKGHETKQTFASGESAFDERAVLREILNEEK